MIKKILMFCFSILFLSGCFMQPKEKEDNSALLALLAVASTQNANSNPLIGTWSRTGDSIKLSDSTNIGGKYSGTFTETYTDNTITNVNNGVLTLSGGGNTLGSTTSNCTTTASYTKTATTITYTVKTSTCSEISTGTTKTHNYTVSGNTMTQTGNDYDANLGSYSWSSSFIKQ